MAKDKSMPQTKADEPSMLPLESGVDGSPSEPEKEASEAVLDVAPAPKTDAPLDELKPAEKSRQKPKASSNLFKIWAHGSLQHNGKTFAPGDLIELTDEEAAAIGPTVSIAED